MSDMAVWRNYKLKYVTSVRSQVSGGKGCLAMTNGRNLQNSATWSQFVEWWAG